MLPRLDLGDRVELNFAAGYAGYGHGLVRGTITQIDDPNQGDESVCYYVTYDTPLKLENPGRYAMVNGCATPSFTHVETDCFQRDKLRALSILEVIAEAAQ